MNFADIKKNEISFSRTVFKREEKFTKIDRERHLLTENTPKSNHYNICFVCETPQETYIFISKNVSVSRIEAKVGAWN